MKLFQQLKTGAEVRKPQREMLLHCTGESHKLHRGNDCTSVYKVEWVSREKGEDGSPLEIREPQEKEAVYTRGSVFTAAGKRYCGLNGFLHGLKEIDEDWAEDQYGRKVLCVKWRFPCFDSFDYLTENRFYRWFFIREGNSISRIYAIDTKPNIYVTDDVGYVEYNLLNELRNAGILEPVK